MLTTHAWRLCVCTQVRTTAGFTIDDVISLTGWDPSHPLGPVHGQVVAAALAELAQRVAQRAAATRRQVTHTPHEA